jgi:D-aminopeptidase
VIPVVGECDDGWLNDARTVQVEAGDAGRAVREAGANVAEGAVGAGTGMICFGWKGGIGTSSRVVGRAHVGVLVLANFGARRQLRIDGVPAGRLLEPPPPGRESAAGSCIVVVATDAHFAAVVDATEESVVNTLWAAEDTDGREGRVVRAVPHEPLLALLREHGRL